MYKVMLVDDEIWVIRALSKLQWERHGFQVIHTTTDSGAAGRAIRELVPDLVITDIRMGEITGLDLLGRFSGGPTSPLFVLISAYGEFRYAQEALRHGAFDYILKPFTQDDMYHVLDMAREELDRRSREAGAQLIHRLEGQDSQATATSLDLPVPGFQGILCAAACLRRFPWAGTLMDGLAALCAGMGIACFPFGDRHFSLLLLEWREDLAPRVGELAERQMAFLGLSGPFDPGRHLGPQVEDARRAACRCLFYDCNPLEFCGSREPQDSLLRTAYLVLSDGVRDGDAGVVHRFLDSLPQLFQTRRANLSTVMEIANHIQGVFQEYAVIHGLSGFQSASMHTAAEFLNGYGSAEGLVQELKRRAELLFGGEASGIDRVRQYIDANYTSIGSVGEIADLFHLDLGYLSRAYKQRTGENIKTAITRRKLDKAREILETTDLQINEVAALCGYGDYFYFARVFRRETGETPSDYRSARRGTAREEIGQ